MADHSHDQTHDRPQTSPHAGDVIEAVEADVRAGLSRLLRPLSFDLVGPFAERGALVDGPFAVVQWELHGVDSGGGFNGMWPTAKAVRVTGVTIVDRRPDPWHFHRHVDWNSLNAQLGGSRGRTSTPLLVKRPDDALFYADAHYGPDGS